MFADVDRLAILALQLQFEALHICQTIKERMHIRAWWTKSELKRRAGEEDSLLSRSEQTELLNRRSAVVIMDHLN